jgi:RNA polymerase sigma-70 factor (ECF subfamily)
MVMSSFAAVANILSMSGTTLSEAEGSSRADESEALLPMDEEGFRAFYERTARPVWAYLYRLAGDPHTADDLLQEAYYRFYRAAARHETEAHRRHSLFTIATNLARDHNRHQQRHPAAAPLPEELPDGRFHHEAGHRTDLTRAISTLKPLQRELLWLAYGQGFSHEEIAGVTGVKRSDVKTLLYRTRQKLAEVLRNGGWTRG